MDYLEEYRCPICTTRHPFRSCRRFLVLAPTERTRVVARYQACQNCLGLSHTIEACRSKHRCQECKGPHHTLLHCPDEKACEWLQMTAWVHVQRPGIDKTTRLVRAMLDPNTKISKAIVTSLQFPYPRSEVTGHKIELKLIDRQSEVRTLTTNMEVVTGPSPFTPHRHGLPGKIHEKYKHNELADFSFHIPYSCCLVLGDDVAKRLYLGLQQLEEGCPYAQKTIFGWSFFGAIPLDKINTH